MIKLCTKTIVFTITENVEREIEALESIISSKKIDEDIQHLFTDLKESFEEFAEALNNDLQEEEEKYL